MRNLGDTDGSYQPVSEVPTVETRTETVEGIPPGVLGIVITVDTHNMPTHRAEQYMDMVWQKWDRSLKGSALGISHLW